MNRLELDLPDTPLTREVRQQLLNSELSYAVSDGDVKLVKVLLAKGADPNAVDDTGVTILHRACIEERLDIVRILLINPNNKADPNIGNEHSITPLFQAAIIDSLDLVKELLFFGADPKISHEWDETPLDEARSNGNIDIVKELENYLPLLQTLSIISIRENKINTLEIPETLFSS